MAASIAGLVGSFDTGTVNVPRTGLAMVHQGEKIITAGGTITDDDVSHFMETFAGARRLPDDNYQR